VTVIVYKFFI